MTLIHSPSLNFVEKTASMLLLIYPTGMLAVKGEMNGVFLSMLLLALVVWMKRPNGIHTVVWSRELTYYAVSMFAMSAAIFLSQTYFLNYAAHPYDAASRYWLAIPVFLFLQRLHLSVFKALHFAFPLAAIAGFLLAKETEYGFNIATLDKIHFGDFELIFSMLSLFSINWLSEDKWYIRLLKIFGCVIGIVASLKSGTRGGWLAIPVFIVIILYFKTSRISLKILMSSLIAAMLFFTIAYISSAIFQQRVNSLVNDVTTFDQGNRDTSTGVRWQLYKAALNVFLHHPIFGVGPEGFALEMQPMLEKGEITPLAAELGRGEVHNDILSKTAGMGIFGLMAILAVYFVPLGLFWKATKSASGQIRQSGILGITFVSGIFVFGLTVEFLNLTLATAFYSFTVAVLLAACYNIHHEEQIHARKSE